MSKWEELSSHERSQAAEALTTWFWVKRIGTGLIVLIALGMGGCPAYNVWEQGMKGSAELKRAEQNRRIKVEEARATLESAELLNQAEVARARGLAEATDIVVSSFGGPEPYLRYLWIQGLENNKASIIYVPTEAGLPILEAGRSVIGPTGN